jgi:hypothetical protein
MTDPTTPKKKSWLKRILKLGLVLFVVLIVVLAVLPTVATKTFLKGTVKSQLAKNVGGGDVSKVEFGWTTGLLVDGLTIPSAAAWAKDKSRAAVTLDHFETKLSVPAAVKAALTGGETEVDVTAGKMSIYLELHPDGKTNLALPEAAKSATPETKPAELKATGSTGGGGSKPLPCSAKAVLDVGTMDIEVADCTSSTGAIQRTVIKGLKIDSSTHVAKDMTAVVDLLANQPTLTFDELKITLEQPGKPDTLVLGVSKPDIRVTATYAGPKSATADKAPLALAPVHQVDAKPTIAVARVYSNDFDLEDMKMSASVETPAGGKIAKLSFDGVLKGQHAGKVHFDLVADLCQKPLLPVTMNVDLHDVDISGSVGKYAPKLLPVLDGATTDAGAQHLPPLTLATKADAAATFDADGKFQKDPTLKSIKDDGDLKLGPGDFEGSTILKGYLEGFNKLELKDVITKAMGQSPFHFDGVEEIFNVKDGVVTIPKLELARQNLKIILAGTCTFDGDYKFGIHLDPEYVQKLEPDVAKLLASVDKAGGIQVEGKLGGAYTVTTPPAEDLAKAMMAGGALDVFRKRNPGGAAKLDSALSKAGVDSKKLQDQPKEAAQDATKTNLEKAADTKTGQQVEKKLGMSSDDAKKKIGGLFGGDKKTDDQKTDDQKKDDQKKDDPKKDDPKKDDSGPSLPLKNPFGGGN